VNIRKADGFALIDLIFVVGMIALLSGIAMPRLMAARMTAGAASAIGSMRTINSSQLTFALTCGGGFYAPSLTVLGTAPPSSIEAFISPTLAGADKLTRGNYIIQMEATPFDGAPPSCNGLDADETGQGFVATGDPAYPPFLRYFATNANGQIFEHNATLWGEMPEVGEPVVGHLLK
jgi:type II secretory pathway pseudopilin PulG